jgi:hypothetical protein
LSADDAVRDRSEFLVSPTPLFDRIYYRQHLPWFTRDSVDPLVHYFEQGWLYNTPFHPAIDPVFLMHQLEAPELTQPLLLTYLEAEGEVDVHPLFNTAVYGSYVRKEDFGRRRLFEVFVGDWSDAVAPFSKLFSLSFYADDERLVRLGQLNPLIHYLSTPRERQTDPNPMFHNLWYDTQYPRVDDSEHLDPLLRYAAFGLKRLDMPNPYAASELKTNTGMVTVQMLFEYVRIDECDRQWFAANGGQPMRRKGSAAWSGNGGPPPAISI